LRPTSTLRLRLVRVGRVGLGFIHPLHALAGKRSRRKPRQDRIAPPF
jgi:hypothetical protein